jgi:hypothetical protein
VVVLSSRRPHSLSCDLPWALLRVPFRVPLRWQIGKSRQTDANGVFQAVFGLPPRIRVEFHFWVSFAARDDPGGLSTGRTYNQSHQDGPTAHRHH